MSLIYIDSFQHQSYAPRGWTLLAGAASFVAGRNGQALRFTGTNSTLGYRAAAAGEHATWVVGAAVKLSHLPSGTVSFMGFYSDDGATMHTNVVLDQTGTFQIRRGSNGLATTANAVATGNWYYVEFKATLADTGGYVELRVNGTTWATYTGDTKNAGTKTVFDQVRIHSGNISGSTTDFDDFYLLNGAGTIRNDFLGDVAIEFSVPNGNGAHAGWVGTDGNSIDNYLLVDDVPIDTADYVSAATDGTKDSYTVADLSRTTGNILGVQATMIGSKSDTGAKSVRAITRIGGVDYFGSDRALANQSWQPHLQTWEQSPASAADWTITEVNGAEFGVEARP